MRVLVVDDNPQRHSFYKKAYIHEDVLHAFTYSQAVKMLNGPRFDVVQLDHDLGDHQQPEYAQIGMYDGAVELTGYHVAWHLVNEVPKKKWPEKVVIHSINPAGAKSIAMLFIRHGVPFTVQPFVFQGG